MVDRTSSYTVRLKDNVSAPARGAAKSLRDLDRTAKSVKGGGDRLGNLTRPFGGRAGTLLTPVPGRLAGIGAEAVAAAGGLTAAALATRAAVTDFAALDRHLRRIAITGDATESEVGRAGETIRKMAQIPGSPGLDNIVLGLDSLVAAGRSLPEAMAFLPSVVVTAQAAGAEVVDIAASADALSASLGIAAGDMQGAFDILVAGGKAGKFELKDMAQFLPTIAAGAERLGIKGKEGLQQIVALAQIIRAKTGSSSEAATALENVLQKMQSQETRNNFKKMGVDLGAGLDKARKSGVNLLDAFIELTGKAIKGDLSKLPLLFNDAQFLSGISAIMSSPDALKKLRGELGNVDGTALRDFGRIANDTQDKIDQFVNKWRELKLELGEAAAPGSIELLTTIQLEMRELQAAWADLDGWMKKTTGKSLGDWTRSLNLQLGGSETNEARKARLDKEDAERKDPALKRHNAAAAEEEGARAELEKRQKNLDAAKAAGASKPVQDALAARVDAARAAKEKAGAARQEAALDMPYFRQGLDAVGIQPEISNAPLPGRNPLRPDAGINAAAFDAQRSPIVPDIATYEANRADEIRQRENAAKASRLAEVNAQIAAREQSIRTEAARHRADAEGKRGAALRGLNRKLADKAEEGLTTDPELLALRAEAQKLRNDAAPKAPEQQSAPHTANPSPWDPEAVQRMHFTVPGVAPAEPQASAETPAVAPAPRPLRADPAIGAPAFAPPPAAPVAATAAAVGAPAAAFAPPPAPAAPQVDLESLGLASEKAEEVGRQMQEYLGITATPQVDTSSIAQALSLVQQLNSELARAGTLAAQAEAAGRTKIKGFNARASFSDIY